MRKGFKCYCGKSYKTSQGLKNHSMVVHNTTSTETLNNSVTRPHSPSSASNGGNNNNNLNNNQSQLSPNSNANGTITVNTTTLSASASPTFTQSVSQSNNQISLKTPPTTNLIAVNSLTVSSPPNNSSHALLSTHNPNKLMKLNTECFDGMLVGTKASGKNLIITSTANGTNGNIIVSATAAIPNASSTDETNGNGAKINLPSLVNVNLGILTPATSPKQHTQLTPQISPNHTPTSNVNNANNNNNNESSLPLTPISPLNKTFNGTASVSIVNATNNNNSSSPNLNNGLLANSITADGSMTEDT